MIVSKQGLLRGSSQNVGFLHGTQEDKMGFGFGMGFDMFGIMFTIVFVLVIGTFIVTAVKGIGQWNKNNNAPRLTVPATVVAKSLLRG